MKKRAIYLSLIFLCFSTLLAAQNLQSDVHLFQNFLKDSPIAQKPYVEPGLNFNSFEYGSSFLLGAQGGYPVNSDLEIGGAVHFINISPEVGDGQSGLSDLTVLGKYKIKMQDSPMDISAGGFLTLPIGNEDVGQGNMDFGAFGALRYPINETLTATGVVGLTFIEVKTFDAQGNEDTSRETSLQLAGGIIHKFNEQMSFVGELNILTEEEVTILSGGVDYIHSSTGRIRGGLGLGLSDFAPDVTLFLGYLLIL